MGKKKIINDPIYGLISFTYEILYSIIDHPYFQRLRRISQMGLSQYVYPGATHTRFHHALGSLHLMTKAIETLRWKGVKITEHEAESVCLAILLHDIGHGPFSHALEKLILPFSHERISKYFMELLNHEYKGQLTTAIEIFENKYPKQYLTQLVSGQLDMDRMDYLIRDSYYTGVAEGVIGYDRIIKMLNVVDGNLVVEEKGLYSIEKFLMARRIMYFQVYLHKTSIVAEKMLRLFIEEYTKLHGPLLGQENFSPTSAHDLNGIIKLYSDLDDNDIFMLLKKEAIGSNPILSNIARRLLDRKLFKIKVKDQRFTAEEINHYNEIIKPLGLHKNLRALLPIIGIEKNISYIDTDNQILILQKEGKVVHFGNLSKFPRIGTHQEIHYAMFPVIN